MRCAKVTSETQHRYIEDVSDIKIYDYWCSITTEGGTQYYFSARNIESIILSDQPDQEPKDD